MGVGSKLGSRASKSGIISKAFMYMIRCSLKEIRGSSVKITTIILIQFQNFPEISSLEWEEGGLNMLYTVKRGCTAHLKF